MPATCAKSWPRSPPPASTGSRSSSRTSSPSMARRPRSVRWCATTGWKSRCSSRSATSRGCPSRSASRAFDRFERKFDLMQQLGTDLVLVCSSVHPEALGGIDRMAADFAELGERAAPRGLRVGFEALGLGPACERPPRRLGGGETGGSSEHRPYPRQLPHPGPQDRPRRRSARIPGDRIFFVQLADAPLIDMDLLYWSRHFRNMPGEGDLDVTGFMRAVAATGYAGPLSAWRCSTTSSVAAARGQSPSTATGRCST